jgi:glycosyltransferase involved in cell wall biosynthesis
MRVLFVTTAYPTPESPVSGIFVREHALAASAHADVAVLHLERTPGVRGVTAPVKIDGEIPVWRVRYRARPALLSAVLHLVAGIRGWRAVRRSGFDPDLVHAHIFLAGVPAALVAKASRKPLVVTEQWSIFLPEDPQPLTPLLRMSARIAYGAAKLVLPVSKALERGIEAAGLRGTFRVIPNVVDTSLFAPAEGPRNARLLAVGLLYEAKGYEYLFQAIALLAARGRDVRLDVVGDGPLRAEYERLVADLGIAGRVVFHGLLPKTDVARRMAEAELLVLTSRYDNNPCVVTEAMASGLPVVATAVGGIPEMIDADNGRLARPRDPESIADEIASALDGIDAFDRVGIARTAAKRYGRERIAEDLAAAYAEAMG